LAEALIAANKDNPFFSDSARQGLVAFMIGHHVVYREYPELIQVLEYTGDEDKRDLLTAEVIEVSKTEGATEEERARQLRAQEALNLLRVAASRSNGKSDVLGSLYNALLPITSGQFRSYVTTNPKNGLTVSKMLENKLIVRIAFTADEGDIGKALGKIIIQQFTDTVLSPRVDKSYLKLIVIDEAHNYVCEALKIGVAQAAGNNAGYMMAFQSLKQIDDEAARSIIFGNCKNKVIIAGAEFFDADTFSKDFGEQELAKISKTNSQSNSASSSNARSDGQSQSRSLTAGFGFLSNTPTGNQGSSKSSSLSQSESKSKSSGENVSYQRRPIWLPRELSTIPRYHAVCVLDDGSSRATPEPHLVRFLKPEERALVEPINDKERKITIHPLLLAATPLPTVALKTKDTPTSEQETKSSEREKARPSKSNGTPSHPSAKKDAQEKQSQKPELEEGDL
jgi:type IV secretory pathway TraG/TraD family ATPase VirD4